MKNILTKRGSRLRLFHFFLLGLWLILPSSISAATPANCLLTWQAVLSPNLAEDNFLSAVAVLGDNDVWAVGGHTSLGERSHSLIVHWDGETWNTVAHPDVPGGLYDIEALSPTDIWAVGGSKDADYPENDVGNALHWDGVEWKIVPGIEMGGTKIAALDANNVWITGNDVSLYHWQGTAFSKSVVAAEHSRTQRLTGIKVFGTNNIWVVGNWFPGSIHFYVNVYHWDGTTWEELETPIVESAFLNAVGGSASDDLYVAGSGNISSEGLLRHWNGQAWENKSLAGLYGGGLVGFAGISALSFPSASEGWAVGTWDLRYPISVRAALVEFWDGETWRVNPMPVVASKDSGLADIAISDGGAAWAVGWQKQEDEFKTLILRGDKPCVEPVSAGAVPELVSPAQRAKVKHASELKWKPVFVATDYQVQVWQGGQKKPYLVNKRISETSLTLKKPQQYHGEYHWRVRACNETACGPWTKVASFTVK